jgi:hypothetical protein
VSDPDTFDNQQYNSSSAQPPIDPESAELFPDLPGDLVPTGTALVAADEADRQRAEQASVMMQDKMIAVIQEFSGGQINQAQFQAVYTRYAAQKSILQKIAAGGLSASAWQQALESDSSTGFLRRQLASQVIGLCLISVQNGTTIQRLGRFDLPGDLLVPILTSLISGAGFASYEEGIKTTLIEGGRWLSLVPGDFAASVVIFSREPSANQLQSIIALHRDFEQANRAMLMRGEINPARLAYPQTVLFAAPPANS